MLPAVLLAIGALAMVIATNLDPRRGDSEGAQVFLICAGVVCLLAGLRGLVRVVGVEMGRAMARKPVDLAAYVDKTANEAERAATLSPQVQTVPAIAPEDGAFRRLNRSSPDV